MNFQVTGTVNICPNSCRHGNREATGHGDPGIHRQPFSNLRLSIIVDNGDTNTSTLTGGGSGKNRSIFSNCLSAVSVRYAVQSFKRMPIDCTIYSQIVSVPVVELGLGLLVVVLVGGGRDVW